MKAPRHILFLISAAAGLGTASCVAPGAPEGGTVVYGDFGPVVPFGYDDPYYADGGIYVHPPYHHDDDRDRDHGPLAPRRAPSIPNRARPAPAGHPGGGDHDRH